jgi:D-alanyl-D-alanine carboxypeptidase
LTKLMTALLVMQDISAGKQTLSTPWPISRRAAGQPASRLGLRSGRMISVNTTLDALLVRSANDAAMVAAEALAGDEMSFVKRMNDTAAALGMTRTRFANPSGLPAVQFTTARDMAVLAQHLWQAFPAQRKRYAQTGFTYAGRWVGTTNALLGSYRGARGMKTGFTCRAGFHLIGAVERGERTLIAVVLGARGSNARMRAIRKLFDTAFANSKLSLGINVTALADSDDQGTHLPASTAIIASSCMMVKGPSGWNINIGVTRSKKSARKRAHDFIRERRKSLRGARAYSIPSFIGIGGHRSIVTGLKEEQARSVCLKYRDEGGSCIIFGEEVATAQLEKMARIRTLAKQYQASPPK